MIDNVAERLKEIVGEERVNASRLERLLNSHDLAPVPDIVARNYKNLPDAVVKPANTGEIARLVESARKNKTPLVPRGSGTSYLWGSVPVTGGIVVDMREMREKFEINESGETVELSTGFTWEQAENRLNDVGLALRIYPTSMPSATIGGWISASGTGLGKGGLGVGSFMYGTVGDNVTALVVVTGEGKTLNLVTPETVSEFVGVDGITGIITKARLKVRKIAEARKCVLLSVPSPEALQSLIEKASELPTVYHGHFEDSGLIEVKKTAGLHTPEAGNGFVALFVFEGAEDMVSENSSALRVKADSLGCSVFPDEEADKEWEERCYPMRVKRAGPTVVAGEFVVPAGSLAEALGDVYKEMPGGAAKQGVHGVLGAKPGIVLMPQIFTDERKGLAFFASLSYAKRFNDISLNHGGQPYGVGHLNAFSADEVHGYEGLARLKRLKAEHDPGNIINPGKGIEHGTRFGIPVPSFAYSISMMFMGLFRKSGV